jgi:hypothetical protein
LLAVAESQKDGDRLLQMARNHLEGVGSLEHRQSLRDLIDRLRQIKKDGGGSQGPATQDYARPRIVACLGPTCRSIGTEAETLTLLYRICLWEELAALGGFRVVEREALMEVLEEQQLGTSELTDVQARLAVSRILPASILLLGSLIPMDNGARIHLRLVDTETTAVLGTTSEKPTSNDSILDTCHKMADDIAAMVVKTRPLSARVLGVEEGMLTVGLGAFHGATDTTKVIIFPPTAAADALLATEKLALGEGTLATLGDLKSSFHAKWYGNAPDQPLTNLWAREMTP